jgi:hypothetical protein
LLLILSREPPGAYGFQSFFLPEKFVIKTPLDFIGNWVIFNIQISFSDQQNVSEE